jgi:prepilin-type N-terminal cleavage/methylation domain-containing protein
VKLCCLNREREEGFTLIELSIVLLVIGILLSIAVPALLSVKRGAQDASAKADLRVMYANALAYASLNSTSSFIPQPSNFSLIEYGNGKGSSSVVYGTSGIPGNGYATNQWFGVRLLGADIISSSGVFSDLSSFTTITMVAHSKSGRCFYLRSANGVITKGWNKQTEFGADLDPGCYTDGTTVDGYPATILGTW